MIFAFVDWVPPLEVSSLLSCRSVVGYLLGALGARPVTAPYVPKSNAQVLERLPFKPNDPVARELARLRLELQCNPRIKTSPSLPLYEIACQISHSRNSIRAVLSSRAPRGRTAQAAEEDDA